MRYLCNIFPFMFHLSMKSLVVPAQLFLIYYIIIHVSRDHVVSSERRLLFQVRSMQLNHTENVLD